MNTELVKWDPDKMLEIKLEVPDNFLKVKETLSRIGIASKKDKTLYQSCHILHKKSKYYIVHFKELFALDGKVANIVVNDIERRNTIAQLLEDWDLLSIVDKTAVGNKASMSQIKVIPYKEKNEWSLMTKYPIGKNK